MAKIGRLSIGLLMALCFFLGTTRVARADSTSNCTVNGSGSTGTTNCSVVVDSNNFANARTNPSTESLGAKVGSSSASGGLAFSTAANNDLFICSTPNPCALVPAITLSIPVTFTFQLDGTASATSNFMELDATYQVLPLLGASGGTFNFSFFEDPGKGPFADTEAAATFTPANGSTIKVPVTLTQDANGNFQFSVDYTTPATPLCSPDCPLAFFGGTAGPSQEVFGDSQSITAQLDGDSTPQSLDAFTTFSVGITSLDPNFQPASLDGRTLNIGTPTPEPSTVLLLASGLVGLLLLSRAHN